MKGTSEVSSLRWRRSSFPDDTYDPYTGGDLWWYSAEEVFTSNLADLVFDICTSGPAPILGCMALGACNFDAFADTDDGSCTYPGCTISAACNYDPSAGCIDESCEFVSCLGCTYPDADNYDPIATIDDGSCTYAGLDCPPDIDGDGAIGTSDLLNLLGDFGSVCP